MSDAARRLQARRSVEDRAMKLGVKRREHERGLERNTEKIIDFLREDTTSSVPLRQLADLLGVSRQTLYRWLESNGETCEEQQAGEFAPARTSEPECATEQDGRSGGAKGKDILAGQ